MDAEGNSLRFNLVCDPKYNPAAKSKRLFDPIHINPPDRILTGCHHTYDMGFSAFAEDLPTGDVKFVLQSPILSRLMQGLGIAQDKVCTSIPVMLSCFKTTSAGRQLRDKRDKRWILDIRTDPATKLPVVRSARSVPIWCRRCNREILGRARVCKTCEDYSLCWLCYLRTEHPSDHLITSVEISL